MKLDTSEALLRLTRSDHGVLSTVHPERGVDAVPVVFAVDSDGFLGIPVDRVKAKASTRLQRERNLQHDPRATVLVEHWDRHDWSRLWWVRAELVNQPDASHRAQSLADRLADRFPQYVGRPFDRILVLRIANVTGWAATEEGAGGYKRERKV